MTSSGPLIAAEPRGLETKLAGVEALFLARAIDTCLPASPGVPRGAGGVARP